MRMMPRRNSVVMNSAATTAMAMNPMRMPPRLSLTTSSSASSPGCRTPRSPAPETVNLPPFSVKDPATRSLGSSRGGPLVSRLRHAPVTASPPAPVTLNESNTAVLRV